MIYWKMAEEYFYKYHILIMAVLSLAVIVFGVINFCKNAYRRQNKKFTLCRKKIIAYPYKLREQIKILPEEYRRQWRAYENSKAERPSLVFEFVRKKNTLLTIRLFIFAAILAQAFLIAFIANPIHTDYILFLGVFWFAFALILLINKIIFVCHEKKARRIFGRFVNELNKLTWIKQEECMQDLDRTVKSLNELNKGEVTPSTLSRASELLRNKGLNTTRTVDEQRKINKALNNLMQAYAKNAKPADA